MTALTRFFAEKTPRERALLAALIGVVLVWLAVTQVWQPLHAQRRDLAAQIPRLERALSVLRSAGALQAPVAEDPRTLPARITEAADAFGLRISRLQPQGAQVQLSLDEAPFDSVLLWVEAMERDAGLHLVDLTLTRRPAPGVVGATLTVGR